MTTIDFDSRPSWKSYWASLLTGFILSFAVVGLFLLAWVIWDRLGNRYTIQSGKIEHRSGVLSKNLKSVRLENLRDLELSQTVMQRMLGIGSIGFSSAGSIGAEVTFSGIANPESLKDSVENYLAERGNQ